tara:strand:+ start:575 stop:799 length:225 start_codon:yes stop_codon:yes gene_type:complete
MKREEIKDILDSFWYGRIGRDEAMDKLLNLHIVSQRELVNKEASKSIKDFCKYVMHPESDLHKDADDWIKEHYK